MFESIFFSKYSILFGTNILISNSSGRLSKLSFIFLEKISQKKFQKKVEPNFRKNFRKVLEKKFLEMFLKLFKFGKY